MAGFDKIVIEKWSPIVDKHLNIRNSYFKYLCCHFFEYHFLKANKIGKMDISNELLDFKEKLYEMDIFKVEIKKEYINILTGRKEYLLENGSIFDPESFGCLLSTDELIQIFGIEFITHLDPKLSRDFKINKILDNDNRE